ncbi:HDOD domain-containing protein [bacterium]|nr:HDOD domain-containing protein [bacterium]
MAKYNILFIDTDENVLKGMRRLMMDMSFEWNLHFVTSAEKAMEYIIKRRIDLVVTEVNIYFQGMEFVEYLSRYYNGIIRVVFSGYSEKNMILKSVSLVHQIILRPKESTFLKDVIKKALNFNKILNQPELSELIVKTQKLPTLPSIYYEFVKEIEKEDFSFKNLADIISKDVALVTTITKLIKSSYWGYPSSISNNLASTLSYLGVEIIKALFAYSTILSTQNRVNSFSIDEFNEHSIMVATLSYQIGNIYFKEKDILEKIFIAGVLHDVGKLVLSIQSEEIYNQYKNLHAEIGAYLLSLWGFDEQVIEGILFHHIPSNLEFSPYISIATVIHISNTLVNETDKFDVTHLSRLLICKDKTVWIELLNSLKKQTNKENS